MADLERRGFLYPKKNRQGQQPNMTGHVIWNGQKIELAAWARTAKNGVKYLSLKAQDAGAAEAEADTSATDTAASTPEDDDLPF